MQKKDQELQNDRDLILDLLDYVLKNNLMEFHGQYFLQIFGIAMGTNLAPILANLYLAMLEEQIQRECYYDSKLIWPMVLKRFIDDMFGIMKGTYEDLKYFVDIFNRYVPSINLNIIKWGTSVDFMDLEIFKDSSFYETGKFCMKTHQKSQSIFDYIPFNSNHPKHTFKNLVVNELNRYVRNSSKKWYYLSTASLFFKRLRRRGYTRKFLKHCFAQVDFSNRSKLLKLSEEISSCPLMPVQGHKKAKLKPKFSKFGVALKVPFRKSFEELGISKIVRETIKEFETNRRNLETGNSKFFSDLTVFMSYKSAQKIGDVLISMKH